MTNISATATGVGLDVERVLEKNDENKLGMTPSEIENQVAFAWVNYDINQITIFKSHVE